MCSISFPMFALALFCTVMVSIVQLTIGDGINCASCISTNTADLLCTAGWRDIKGLDSMSSEDERNTLIVELDKRTKDTGGFFQSKPTDWLVAAGNLYLILGKCGWRTESGMENMEIEDLRNTCIVELNKKQYGSGEYLQSLSNIDLVTKACDYYDRANKPQEVVSFSFHIDQGKMANNKPELLGSETYNNCGSGVELNQEFTIQKEYSETNSLSFSRESSTTVDLTIGVSFEAPLVIGSVSGSTSLSVSQSSTIAMNTAKATANTVTYSVSSPVVVPPYRKIRKELIVNVADISVPFIMIVKTRTGEQKTITGTYHGVKTYNKQIIQSELQCND